MTLQAHNRLILSGFVLDYTAVMGSLVVAGAPILQGYRPWLFSILLGIGVGGALLIAIGKLSRVDAD